MRREGEILALNTRLGVGITLEEESLIANIGGVKCEELFIGDHAFIGSNVRILAPSVFIGDYTVIHQRTTIYGYSPVRIGHSCWIGQDTIINCTSPVWIGNGVTIGAKSSLWTHLSGGDVLQGFRFARTKPALVMSDVWIGPNCTVSPVRIEEKTCVLAGSVVTNDLSGNRIFAGAPAKEVTEKLGGKPFQSLSVEEKFAIARDRLISFDEDFKKKRGAFSVFPTISDWRSVYLGPPEPGSALTVAGSDNTFTLGGIVITTNDCAEKDGFSVFSVSDRRYTKRLTVEEVSFIKYLLPAIKFFPLRDPTEVYLKNKFNALLEEFGISI